MNICFSVVIVVIYIQIFYDICPLASGRSKRKHFALSIKNMKLLTKIEKTARVKQLNEEFRLSTPPSIIFKT